MEGPADKVDGEDSAEVASTLSGLLAGLPTIAAGSQRIASSLRQRFADNSGESSDRGEL